VKLPDLLFGVATSDHQAEAYDPQKPDFRDQWEKEQGQTLRGKATDFWNRYPEDIGLARDLGCKIFRFSVSWARIEPRAGDFDLKVLDHYRKLTETIHEAGMLPLVTLHHFTWPIHVQERGGMTADEFPRWYRDYVHRVADAIGDLVPYWITFNEPNLLVYGYVKPWWQPEYLVPPGRAIATTLSSQLDEAAVLIRNIFLAHRLGREAIRKKNPAARVGANPFVLGLPGPLQFFIDWLATRTSSKKAFYRQNRKMAEQAILARTQVDLVISQFTPTRERAAEVAFSYPYSEGVEQLVVRRHHAITQLADLAGRRVGFVHGSIALRTILRLMPNALPCPFRTHREGLEALQAGEIDGFVGDETGILHAGLLSGLVVQESALAKSQYAVGIARGNPDLLALVNASITAARTSGTDTQLRGKLLRRIRRRGYLRVGLSCDPEEAALNETLKTELALAQDVGRQIFGRDGCVQFEKLQLDERVASLSPWSRFLVPLLRTASVIGTVLNSNWWHLGMAGKLPAFLCPRGCAGKQDFVGVDYYWGIDAFELKRIHQLIDASLARFDDAPVDPPGLLRALSRFHRWFPKLEILIIENGCIEAADEFTRAEYLRAHIREVTRARAVGIPVRAYICWSITSNREWGLPFGSASDFGLYHIDLDSDPELKRIPTQSAAVYKQIIQEETPAS
jgi:beta-glucosidase/6-phospho-beta-glucosidase/beta-galactosidase